MFLEQLNITNYSSKLNAISWIRNEYEKTINRLKDNKIISLDEAFNFKETQPDLSNVANEILSSKSHLDYNQD